MRTITKKGVLVDGGARWSRRAHAHSQKIDEELSVAVTWQAGERNSAIVFAATGSMVAIVPTRGPSAGGAGHRDFDRE
jgi:predicted transcriptional regulator